MCSDFWLSHHKYGFSRSKKRTTFSTNRGWENKIVQHLAIPKKTAGNSSIKRYTLRLRPTMEVLLGHTEGFYHVEKSSHFKTNHRDFLPATNQNLQVEMHIYFKSIHGGSHQQNNQNL